MFGIKQAGSTASSATRNDSVVNTDPGDDISETTTTTSDTSEDIDSRFSDGDLGVYRDLYRSGDRGQNLR